MKGKSSTCPLTTNTVTITVTVTVIVTVKLYRRWRWMSYAAVAAAATPPNPSFPYYSPFAAIEWPPSYFQASLPTPNACQGGVAQERALLHQRLQSLCLFSRTSPPYIPSLHIVVVVVVVLLVHSLFASLEFPPVILSNTIHPLQTLPYIRSRTYHDPRQLSVLPFQTSRLPALWHASCSLTFCRHCKSFKVEHPSYQIRYHDIRRVCSRERKKRTCGLLRIIRNETIIETTIPRNPR